MGNVYLGVHAETGERAAVKVLPASMAREEGFEQRFSREIAALRKLSHRNIVRLYGDGVSDEGLLYYAMEYVDGVTLTAEQRRAILSDNVAQLYGIDVEALVPA